uniref:Uncharacterized protein n=1 Tax=Vitis vinifera TaxID=29760 RepID=F6H0G6_VITVI
MGVEGAKAEQPPKMVVEVELVAQPCIKRPKINGSLAPAKRGVVKMLIFDSLASMFGSEYNPVSSEAPIPSKVAVTAPTPDAEKCN